jgi:hypothetical protein
MAEREVMRASEVDRLLYWKLVGLIFLSESNSTFYEYGPFAETGLVWLSLFVGFSFDFGWALIYALIAKFIFRL